MPPVEGHHDFAVLERRLVDLIREVKSPESAGPLAPVAVVVPSKLLARHVEELLAEKLGSVLNVSVFHHESLQARATAAQGAILPRRLVPAVLESILEETVAGQGGDLASYAAARPGSVAALRATMDDLRDAGLTPAAAREVPGLGAGAGRIVDLFAAYEKILGSLLARGLSDRAGRARSALPHVKAWAAARKFERIIHYGAYELTGRTLEIWRALAGTGADVRFLLPWHPEAPAFAYARSFATETLGVKDVALVEGGPESGSMLGGRLTALYDESCEALTPAGPAGGVALFHAQGAAAELREVALRILALHGNEGVPLRRIAVVARTLVPYTPLLKRILFDEHQIPFFTSAASGSIREARALAAVWLARVVFEDFERQPLMDLFRSGLFRSRGGGQEELAHTWDRFSREFRLARGFQTWTRDLPRWMDQWEPRVPHDADAETIGRAQRIKNRRRREAKALADTLIDLHRSARELIFADGWAAWAAAMEKLCGDVLVGFGRETEPDRDHGKAAVLSALDQMRTLEEAGVGFTRLGALDFFKRAVSEESSPIGPDDDEDTEEDNGGVRVLDAMKARGLLFDTVFLIGFNADLFPRRPREDAFLRDADRRLLREKLACPLPVKLAGREEEHLILAHMLGSARARLVVSWQRADENGRARVPSLALRELARVALGSPDLDVPLGAARSVPAHPAEACRDAAARHRLLPPATALMGAAFDLRSPAGLLEAKGDMASIIPLQEVASLEAGLRMLSVVEDFSSPELSYDAFVGDAVLPPADWSPSRLETYANCPQQYFFRQFLRVDELQEPAEGHEMDVREVGERIHRILHDAYRKLLDDAEFHGEGADTGPLTARVTQVVDEAWAAQTSDLAQRMLPRYPILWRAVSEIWKTGLRTFLLYDISRLRGGRAGIVGLELPVEIAIPMDAAGAPLALQGRFDRIVTGPDGSVVVGDYKSAGKLQRHVDPAQILKGHRMQMALYLLMARRLAPQWGSTADAAGAEVIGVGPEHVAGLVSDETDTRERPGRAALTCEKFEKIRAGFMETLGVLVSLAGTGSYPLSDGERCKYCPYARACRRLHAPTLARLAAAPGVARFRRLSRKSTRAMTLADVEAGS